MSKNTSGKSNYQMENIALVAQHYISQSLLLDTEYGGIKLHVRITHVILYPCISATPA